MCNLNYAPVFMCITLRELRVCQIFLRALNIICEWQFTKPLQSLPNFVENFQKLVSFQSFRFGSKQNENYLFKQCEMSFISCVLLGWLVFRAFRAYIYCYYCYYFCFEIKKKPNASRQCLLIFCFHLKISAKIKCRTMKLLTLNKHTYLKEVGNNSSVYVLVKCQLLDARKQHLIWTWK